MGTTFGHRNAGIQSGLPASRGRLDYLAGNIRTFGHRWAQLKLVDCRDLIFATEGEFEKVLIRIETKLNVWTVRIFEDLL